MGVPSEKYTDALRRMESDLDILEATLEWVFPDPETEDLAAHETLGIRAHLRALKGLQP